MQRPRAWRAKFQKQPEPPGVVEHRGAVAAPKTCTHQQAEGPDLLCLAATSNEKTIGTIGRHRVASTSRPVCAGCQMPDAAVVCSQFSRPQVTGVMTMGGFERELDGALCNLGREEIQQPGKCHAAGHQCWQRVVGLEVATPTEVAHPRALAEVLDAVAAWCSQALIQMGIFPARIRAWPGCGACLKTKISDPDSLERANQTLDRLARLQRSRSLLQHPGGHDELVRKVAALGLAWPPADWAAAWERVRAEAADALAGLRDELRMLAEMAS